MTPGGWTAYCLTPCRVGVQTVDPRTGAVVSGHPSRPGVSLLPCCIEFDISLRRPLPRAGTTFWPRSDGGTRRTAPAASHVRRAARYIDLFVSNAVEVLRGLLCMAATSDH